MTHKKIKASNPVLFAGLLIIGIVIFLLPQGLNNKLNFLFFKLFNPVLSIGRNTTPEIFRPAPSSKDFVTRREYDRLWIAYKNLYADLVIEHKRFDKLAQIRSQLPKPGPKLVLAGVISSPVSGFRNELIINKGSDDGIKTGQYVLGENSIVGTIKQTSQSQAKIRLITDENHKVKVRIWRWGRKKNILAQMCGDGKNCCKIPLISREHDVKIGDTVYAAVQPGFLEAPRAIGEVSALKLDENSPLLWDITVTPAYDVEKLTDVAIVITDP